MNTNLLRQHAEAQFQQELEAVQKQDKRPRPPNWRLSPWAVTDYIMGTDEITAKYIGDRRLVEVAVATLATDRALLLLGLPGTAKTWLSEHLAAAISGDSTLLVQGTAGTEESAIRYGWNYARLINEGPSEEAMVASPIIRGMRQGKLVRIEEMTRMPSDVQDALITVLSEKAIPIPELDAEVQASRGFNVIATSNTRDRGVNELSSALRRRFNTVILPLPATLEEEVMIVQKRSEEIGQSLELPKPLADVQEIQRIVTIFRELREGMTEDRTIALKSPSATLSTAEAIAVVNQSLALATHFGDGKLSTKEVAQGLVGAIIRDPGPDGEVFREYLETVAKKRKGWADLYQSCRELM